MPPKRQPAAAAPTLSSGPQTLKPNASVLEIARFIWSEYTTSTPQRTMLLDAFMGFLAVVAVVQFVYCVVAGNFPFNAFLSGFCAAVGQFVLTASLRMQTSGSQGSNKPSSKGKNARFEGESDNVGASGEEKKGVSHERYVCVVSHVPTG
ncbi:Oligosaccharyl transferase subunit [Aspergillus sp. HF37]|nr:Oligosaccharyl transferase subunit [Aspergillus sp. HF37]